MDDNSKTFDEYVEECDRVVHESVAAHRIADVKVSSFLSGGVDSSYIAACLMPDKTFSVGFDYKDFNETNYAKELSDKLGIENYRKMVTAGRVLFEVLPQIRSPIWTSRRATCRASPCGSWPSLRLSR